MRFGIDIAQQRMEWDELLSRALLAEELGFDGAWGFDHFQPMYGDGPGNCFEGMTMLAALGASTSRIRLGLLVTGVTYRHPSVLAVEAVTVDHASHGRLELALGSAWFDPEHASLGIEFPPTRTRFDRLEDALEVLTRLFTGERVSYDGKTMALREAQVLPRPVQRPHPPIWIGGTGPKRTLPLVSRYADAWHAYGSPDSLRAASDQIDRLAAEAGRDPKDIMRAASLGLSEPMDEVRKKIDDWRDAGFDYLVCSWPSEGRERVEEFAHTVLDAGS
jgi:F420-dependent oxidoreductase-like protein